MGAPSADRDLLAHQLQGWRQRQLRQHDSWHKWDGRLMPAYRLDGTIQNPEGFALQGMNVYVCTQPASTGSIPPSPLATLYTNANGNVQATNPATTDGNGNYFFYAATGTYTLVLFDPLGRVPTQIFPDQQVVTQGGGSVTSVAMTGDGTIFNATVTGSPITAAGTLVPALINQNANLVLSGPASGGAAAPTWRKLVSADMPAGLGTVSSVALTIAVPSFLSQSVTGSRVTTSGTLAITLTL